MDNATIVSSPSQNVTKKKVNKGLVTIVILVVIALAGVGFGIFGMVANGQANQKADALNEELAQKDTALKQIEEKLGAQIEVETEDSDRKDDAIASVNVSAAKDYIYIGEWGIKIKVPENLHSVAYVYHGGKNVLYVSGVVCDGGRCQYYPEFMENTIEHGSGLGALTRHHKSEAGSEIVVGEGVASKDVDGRGFGMVVYTDEEYFYTYEGPNGIMGTGSEAQWEVESVKAVKDMLTSGVSAF